MDAGTHAPRPKYSFARGGAGRIMVAVGALGFASGLPYMLVTDGIAFWLADAKVPLEQIGLLALVTMPYALKFLWAPLLDRYPVPLLGALGRRRGWLVAMQVVCAAALAAIAMTGPDAEGTQEWLWLPFAVFGLSLSIVSASLDIVIDAYRTDALPPWAYGPGASVYVAGYRIASMAGGSLMFLIAARAGWSAAFVGMGVLMGLTMVATLLAPEPVTRGAPATLGEALAGPLRSFARAWGVWLPAVAVFVLLYRLPDLAGNRMVAPLLKDRGYTLEEIALVRQHLGFAVTIVGALAGGWVVARVGIARCLLLFGVLQAASNGAYALLASVPHSMAHFALAVVVENGCNGLVAATFTAYLMSLCDHRYSAAQYAMLSGLMFLGGALASAASGFIAERSGMASYYWITVVAGAPGIAMVPLMLRVRSRRDAAQRAAA
ncbi:MAG: AmpG family muropeptide MFS transporter [Phycisphaerales bacterium]|nr:AmpG family muropeptide MFS transporter [Phycisphaerales bacterium]